MAAAEEDAKMATEATASPTAAATVSTSGAATGAAAAGGGTSAGAPAMASPLASLQLCLHELLHAILSFLLRLNEGGGSARLRSTGHGLVHALLPLAAEPFFGCLHKTVQAILAILLRALLCRLRAAAWTRLLRLPPRPSQLRRSRRPEQPTRRHSARGL
ncbi:hypothetical protein Ctob_016571 [Chrysochromulina tobinii]|uniref:Uncharacterized protein n=1 Tax=Chrysochromulina tobinii TaxID=1460289 RepID=A0A0M0JZ99_9EUKA|nr:hypothetical protein Ctob_016571 [Chrysochromulina tobinii]|eukprot:KOO31951.1 hypothetical protein Ctob_016571 [Chrysochromulina sp. CCMP291]